MKISGRTLKVFNITWIIGIYLFTVILLCGTGSGVHGKIGYFWHITDLHLDPDYSMRGDVTKSCWYFEHRQENTPNRPPGRFGDYLCDSPWSLLESATKAMKSRQGDNVEFVLWTGDALAHSVRKKSESHRMELLRNITDLLSRTFSSQFVFPVLGHEDLQGYRRLGELFKQWLPSEALATFEKGGYYTIEQTKSRLRIIALNTNLMRHDNKYLQTHSAAVRQSPGSTGGIDLSSSKSAEYNNHHYHQRNQYWSHTNSNNNGYNMAASYSNRANVGNVYEHMNSAGMVSALSAGESHESKKQWDWLKEVLAKANANRETVYIVGHIPPGSDERQIGGSQQHGHTTFSDNNNLQYLNLVRKYSSIILGQFFGHLHSDSFRIIYDESGKPVSWIMIAPSVTPRKLNVGSNNPAMRLYKFDTDTGQVLDYTQYYLDLAASNAMGEAVWQPEYNLTTHYFGSGEVTAVALHNLADRFPNMENPLFSKYYRANSVRLTTTNCEGACALNHYCAITRVDYGEFKQCLATAASALASSSSKSSDSTVSHVTLLVCCLFTIFLHCHHRKILLDWLNYFIFIRYKYKESINDMGNGCDGNGACKDTVTDVLFNHETVDIFYLMGTRSMENWIIEHVKNINEFDQNLSKFILPTMLQWSQRRTCSLMKNIPLQPFNIDNYESTLFVRVSPVTSLVRVDHQPSNKFPLILNTTSPATTPLVRIQEKNYQLLPCPHFVCSTRPTSVTLPCHRKCLFNFIIIIMMIIRSGRLLENYITSITSSLNICQNKLHELGSFNKVLCNCGRTSDGENGLSRFDWNGQW